MGLSAFERRPWQWPARDGGWTDLCDLRRRPLSRDPFPDRETALASADRRRYPRLADQLRRERAAVCRLFNGRHSDELCAPGIRTLVHQVGNDLALDFGQPLLAAQVEVRQQIL